jgi:hypothetical protein
VVSRRNDPIGNFAAHIVTAGTIVFVQEIQVNLAQVVPATSLGHVSIAMRYSFHVAALEDTVRVVSLKEAFAPCVAVRSPLVIDFVEAVVLASGSLGTVPM